MRCFEDVKMDEELRDANKRLLRRLKQSQNEISRLIIAAKHSDARFTGLPLTSTVANRSVRGKDALQQSGRLLSHARKALTKSPGILKRSNLQKERVKVPVALTPDPDLSPSPEKYKIISGFLQEQAHRGRSLTYAETSNKQPFLNDPGNTRPVQAQQSTTQPTSVLVQSAPEKSVAKVKFQSDIEQQRKDERESNPRSQPPLLGYDWIAGVVENEDPTAEHSDSFLDEIKEFRSLNRSDCQSKRCWNDLLRTPKTPLQEDSPKIKLSKPSQKSPDPSDTKDPRIVNFTINKRLFPVPVDPSDCGVPGTETSPRYIRVSIPKTSLISPHCYRPKSGKESIGADSLALPDHCAMGWQSTVPKRAAKGQSYSCLDLRSSLKPVENLTRLQLRSGQASIGTGLKPSSAHANSVLDESRSMQYRLRQPRKRIY